MTGQGGSLSTWLVIVGVFVAGGLGGAAVHGYWDGSNDSAVERSTDGPERARRGGGRRGANSSSRFTVTDRFMKHLSEELGLTPEQSTAIRAILDERERETKALFESIEPGLRQAVDRTEVEIRDLLSESQRDQFNEIVRDGRRRHGRRGGSSRSSPDSARR